ncbi:hypothetical protein SAMN05421741_11411 [Paenimyroides ummariense]|uniref:Uncharacterized protein n=1 Tax=Paenimyroides ummariense TaxID=913024 RepID=A0A1I5CZJ7_9FLAO|nr:hypothetical protein SAMN05421741_11411 [Paenimyroides ummariense]
MFGCCKMTELFLIFSVLKEEKDFQEWKKKN